VAGCSTGEEAYSLAISLHEFLSPKHPDMKVQIFASDISENVISKARTAMYTRQEVQNVPEARLKNYFSKIDGAYHINKEIRDMCVFAVHNFVKDPPFAKMDLISCRNVLIYLDPFLQKKALSTFHYSLRSQGFLFLGKSETASLVPSLFEPLVKNHKIFIRKHTADAFVPVTLERMESASADKQQLQRKKTPVEPDFQKLANEILFTKYTPAGVIINEQKEIVHFHGDTSAFLLPPPGKPNFNIFKMVREGLTFELRTALLKVKNSKQPVLRGNIPLKGIEYMADIEVIPLEDIGTEPHFLILFHKSRMPLDDKKRASQRKTADLERIKQLEAEIEQMREDIRRVTEDQEAANEELQSANEELLSNSEELQTLNEELETSAEELQSNNEELITVNDELIDRQEQLTMARLYSEAIIETIREPLVILNKEMRVKSANAAFYRNFKTTENEIEGRMIFDTVLGQGNLGDIKNDISKIFPEKIKLDDVEIKVMLPDSGERTMMLNIRPIINDNLGEQLILLAIEDITDLLAANKQLLQNNRELEENNNELTSFSYVTSHDLQEPLRKIHLFSKLIIDSENEKLSAEAVGYLERIVVSTRRMQQLIDDLLHYSQISRADEDDLQETDISQVIEDSVSEIKDQIEAKNAAVSIGSLPTLKVIPTLVRQLFINLIANSIKYSKKDEAPAISVTYTVASRNEVIALGGDGNATYCKIKISDNGIGFAPGQESRIFEPFQRLHGKDKYEGTGIGLAICKKIMSKHKGFINASGVPGQGANFNLYFVL
ncbi:MAG TPA: CheR family methyltransferase, partial [Flavobacterium sp.]|nr:CheR family methyltransferase [Flavobacterium sp.]